MTFIAGFLYKGTIAIAADSAETLILPFAIPAIPSHLKDQFHSSFMEAVHLDTHSIVGEEAQKLYEVWDKAILTFAGNVETGLAAIEELRYNLLKEKPIRESIVEVLPRYNDNQFIVGFFSNDGPFMYYQLQPDDFVFVGDDPKDRSSVCILTAGNTEFGHSTMWAEAIKMGAANELSVDQVLLLGLASLQSLSINEKTIQSGIGGHFNGIMMDINGVRWVDDTFYLLYSAKNFYDFPRYGIHKFNRNSACFVLGTTKRIFLTELQKTTVEELIQRWDADLLKIANSHSEKYFICISYDSRNVLVVDTEKVDSPIKYDSSEGVIRFTPWAMDSMLHDVNRHHSDSRAFHLFSNFLLINVLNVQGDQRNSSDRNETE